MNSNNVLLIDGNSLAFRAFFAMRHVLAEKLEVKDATNLFQKWISKFVSNYDPNYMAVAFDVDNRESENNKLFSEYKAGRKIDPLLKNNFDKFISIPKGLDILTLGIKGHEADDVIATLTKHFQKLFSVRQFNLNIISGDKDLLQLVNDKYKTKVLSPISGTNVKTWTEETVCKKFPGVCRPEQVADYKALVGDSSDGYIGINGIGPKNAQLLLNKYQNFLGIKNNIANDQEIPSQLKQTVINGLKQGNTSYSLAKLDTDVPLPISRLSELEYSNNLEQTEIIGH